jgi:hypothetical protein
MFDWRYLLTGETTPPAVVDKFPRATPEQTTQINAWLKDRQDRALPLEMICCQPPKMLGEEVIFCLPNVELMEPRAIRYSQRQLQGRSAGTSIRIMKGLSIRTGGFGGTSQGQSESVDELRVVDRGTLVLTSKRLVFLGTKRTSNVKLKDIITVDAIYQDGFELHREHKDRAETFVFTEPMQIQEGSGQYLGVFPSMVCSSIIFAKAENEAGPEAVATYRERCEAKLMKEAAERKLAERGAAAYVPDNVIPFPVE